MNLEDFQKVAISAISGGTAGLFSQTLREWWIEKVKSKNTAELEKFKGSLAHGFQITKTQFDVELGAYKELWATLGDVRNHARSFLSQEKFAFVPKEGSEHKFRVEAFAEAMKNFHAAHNEAIFTTERLAPFYPHNIKEAARKVTMMNMSIINFYAAITDETLSKPWFAELEARIDLLRHRIDDVEQLIRDRLQAVRVLD